MESPIDTFCRYTCQWFRRWKCHVTIRLSRFESLSNSVGKIVWKNPCHHTAATFQKHCIVHRRYSRYIPTNLETELYPSAKIPNGIFPSVFPLVFADFLVVILWVSSILTAISWILLPLCYTAAEVVNLASIVKDVFL
jgi:hypothetical protein